MPAETAPMPPHPASLRFAVPAVALALLAGAAAAAPAPRAAGGAALSTSPDLDVAGAAAALVAAEDRAARAAAAIDALKRALAPGHLTESMPDADRAFGLAAIRADYADAQRRAAGYRATLGDQHPTLLATEQLMDGLRGQLLDGTRRALASAERDAADARTAVAAAERRLSPPPAAGRAADVTGSIAPARPVARTASPLSLPPSVAADRPPAEIPPARTPAPRGRPLRALVAAVAAALLAALIAAWAALRLLRPRRPRAVAVPSRRVEPALAMPPAAGSAASEPAGTVPVLPGLTLPRSDEDLEAAFAGAPEGGIAAAASALHATLRAAFGGDPADRMTVLVSPAAGLPEALVDAAAMALSRAAAAAGRRALVLEARAVGRLRGALVPAGAAPTLVEAGGTVRTLYRLTGGPAVALLPSDAGEAEAAAAADRRPGTARLRGLGSFDTVILVGDDAETLAAGADLLLLAARPGVSPSLLAEAALGLCRAGRPCAAVPIELAASAPAPGSTGVQGFDAARRRVAPDPIPAARLGLRGSVAPQRRRVGG